MRVPAGALSVAFALLLLAPPVQGQTTFTRAGSGARAAGMANAFIAVSDDGTAASWNPGGLAQLRKPELSLVTTTIGHTTDERNYRSVDGVSSFTPSSSAFQDSYLDFASLAAPATLWGKPVTFQGSWRRLYSLDDQQRDSTVQEPIDPSTGPAAVRFDLNDDTRGSVNVGSIAAAVKLTRRLALGASYNFWRGDWTSDFTVIQTPLDGATLPSFLAVAQDNRIRGDNLALGLLLGYPRFSLGLVHQAPLRSSIELATSATSSVIPGTLTTSTEGTLYFPRSYGAGAAFHPSPLWTVALDLTWDEWSDTTIETPVTGAANLFDGLPPDRTSTRDTLSINAGAERLFVSGGYVVPLRFGVAWEPQGARSPYTLDGPSFVMLALGTGYNTNSLKFDAAFQYRFTSFEDGTSFLPGADQRAPLAVGETSQREWRLKFSVILRVTDSSSVRRGLKKIFG